MAGAVIGGTSVRNERGEWIPAIHEPEFVGWRLRKSKCECGRVFATREQYRGHYALVHMLGLT